MTRSMKPEERLRLRQEARTQIMPVVVRVRGPKGFDERPDPLLAST